MKSWFKAHLGLSIISVLGLLSGITIILVIIFVVLFSTNSKCNPDSDSSVDIGVASIAGGDWTVKGTETYNNAKAIFDFMTQKVGMSGAGAAGVVGNALVESTFNPKASNGTHFGLFQWTQDRLESGGYIKSEDDKTVENELKVLKYELDHGYTTAKVKVGKESDPATAAKLWDDHFEKSGGQALDKRQAGAVKAYELFSGSNISSQDSLLNGVTENADTGVAADAQNDSNTCSIDGSSEADGTGEVPEGVSGKIFAANEIPESLKKYLLPINVSDARGVPGEAWSHPGGQCVDYVVSEATVLWNNTQSWSLGNGVDQVNSAIKFGYAVKDDKPHKGDLVSCDGTDPSIGHTWIVGHVFADGSVLLQEQNYPGKSGDDMGSPKTWDVAVLPPYKDGAWSNLPAYGATLDHPVFAKPAHGMKK